MPDWEEVCEKWGGPESRERVSKMLHCLEYWAYLRRRSARLRARSGSCRPLGGGDARYLRSKYSRVLKPHLIMDEQGRVIGIPRTATAVTLGCQHFWTLQDFVWVSASRIEVEPSQMEVDGVAEPLAVAVPAGEPLDPRDLGVSRALVTLVRTASITPSQWEGP